MSSEETGKTIAGPASSPTENRRNEGERVVSQVEKKRDGLQIGKPQRVVVGSMRSQAGSGFRSRVASSFGGFGGGGASAGFGGNAGPGAVNSSAAGNFYSPELSTDFLELPQSLNEQWNYYRFFYNNEPFVGQAIDLHTELPLSKVRLARPKAKDKDLAERSLRFCEKWVERIGLLQRLLEIVHDYFLIGEVFIFCEDANPEMPREIREKVVRKVESDGTLTEEWVERDEADESTIKWLKENYKGLTNIRILPPEQVHVQTFPFTDEVLVELIPDAKTRHVLEMAEQGDRHAQRVVNSMDPVVVDALRRGDNIPLSTDPDGGSFVHYMANKKSQYEPRGHSILQRCLRTLVYFDKLRQAQTSIASRHMTPVRLVYAEDMSEEDTENLRDQIDLALQDPDYSIVTNFQVTWEEMNSNGRLLELAGEYDLVSRQLYAGLGVTESLLNGESSYSGDRINLEVINTRYMLLRENVQRLVEQYFFKPMCRRMGFVEEDEDGDTTVIFPRLSFTRLALRDNQDTFDALFQLYQKGSLDIETILDLLNIDPVMVRERLKRDFATFNDAQFNEVLRSLYSRSGDQLVENSDIVDKIAEQLGLDYAKPDDAAGGFPRFASVQKGQPETPASDIADAVLDKISRSLEE